MNEIPSLNSIYNILSYLALGSTIIPFIFWVLRKQYFKTTETIVFILILVSIFTEIACYVYQSVFRSDNIVILNGYAIVETTLICLFYYMTFLNKWTRIFILLALFFYLIMAIQQIIINHKGSIGNISLTVEAVIIILLSIFAFHDLLKRAIYPNILDASVFWINSAFLIFFAGNLFLYLFSSYLQKHSLYVFFELWGLWHSLLNITFYTLISIGFWKTRTSQI